MKYITCKCGHMEVWSSGVTILYCLVCPDCHTTYGGGEAQPHKWREVIDEKTDEHYRECQGCFTREDSDEKSYEEIVSENKALQNKIRELYGDDRTTEQLLKLSPYEKITQLKWALRKSKEKVLELEARINSESERNHVDQDGTTLFKKFPKGMSEPE